MKWLLWNLCAVVVVASSDVAHVYAKGVGTGARGIFDLAGRVQPDAWSDWSEREKHAYLRDLGIYPENGRKYEGAFDRERYFAELGTVEPANWAARSQQERIAFVTALASGDARGDTSGAPDAQFGANADPAAMDTNVAVDGVDPVGKTDDTAALHDEAGLDQNDPADTSIPDDRLDHLRQDNERVADTMSDELRYPLWVWVLWGSALFSGLVGIYLLRKR